MKINAATPNTTTEATAKRPAAARSDAAASESSAFRADAKTAAAAVVAPGVKISVSPRPELQARAPVDAQKVAELRQKLENGELRPDANKIAAKLLSEASESLSKEIARS